MNVRPSVSVIVAVYNRENLLKRCLDSLVYQTLDDIEIIVVDDFSTDNSLEIARSYERRFSKKVKIYSNLQKGVAYAKNLGIEKAAGKYITFCDSDDYVEYWAFEKMFCLAQEHDYDIVCAPFYKIQNGVRSVGGRLSLSEERVVDKDNLFSTEIFPLWNKLFKKECFEKFGLLPLFSIGEDVSWLYPCISYVDHIGYMEKPYYYYEVTSDSVSASDRDYDLVLELLKGNDYILAHSNPEYKKLMEGVCVRRVLSFMERRWLFKDILIEYLKTHLNMCLNNEYLSKFLTDQEQYQQIILKSEETIPMKLYYNPLGDDCEEADLVALRKTAFRVDGKIEMLTLDNLTEYKNSWIRQAIEDKKYNYILEYIALNKIYENGGIYITKKVILNETLDCFKYDGSFWSYVDNETINDQIFGAAKGNLLIKNIIDTYELPNLYEDLYPSLETRIKTILIVMIGLPLVAAKKYVSPFYNAVIYPPTMFFMKFRDFNNVSTCVVDQNVKMVTFPESSLEAIMRNEYDWTKGSIIQLRRRNHSLQNRIDYLTFWNNRRVSYIEKVEAELEAIRKSNSWRLTAPIRTIMSFIKKMKG